MTQNIFERATRQAFRYQSSKGELTTEQLWDLPLQSKTGFDLDNVAKAINRDIKVLTEESFVQTATPAASEAQIKLEVVKHVIATKIAENAAAATKAQNAAMKAQLVSILEQKQSQELLSLTPEQLKAKIDALG